MVGHAALAFALGALVASRLGVANDRALLFGVAAGAFAVVPDLDIGYAFVNLAQADLSSASGIPEVFWGAGNKVHRGMTHSLLVGGAGAIAFGLVAYRGALRVAGLVALVGMVAATLALVGPLEAAVLVTFVLGGVVVAEVARRRHLEPNAVLAAALIGVLSHPFGDLFTGTAPQLLYPLDIRLLPTRVVLSADPTMHLLAVFALELATVWLAFVAYSRLSDTPLWPHVHPRAVLGAGYAAVVIALPPPTLDVSYHFVVTVLAVGTVGVFDLPVPDLRSAESRRTMLLTGLAAISLGLLAYTVAYLIVS